MTTRLPPPPEELPQLRRSDVLHLGRSTDIGRIYFNAGAHPQSWNRFRSDGPVSSGRFDHHRGSTRERLRRGIRYDAPSRGRGQRPNDPLEACVLEVFGSTRTIDLSTLAPWFVLWRPTRPLLLLDLVDGPWLSRAGGNGAISTGPRAAARAWSRHIYEQYSDVDGLYYQSSNLPSHRCMALYERAADALPSSYRLNMPLNHPGLRPALRRIAIKYDLRLVL